MTMNSCSLRPRKRAVTINLDAGLVAQIETFKAEGKACGIDFSVTQICAAALAEAVPLVQEEMQRHSGTLAQPTFPCRDDRSDSRTMEMPE